MPDDDAMKMNIALKIKRLNLNIRIQITQYPKKRKTMIIGYVFFYFA